MAWTSTVETVLWAPFVVTKITITDTDTTPTAVSHGGPGTLAPNLVFITGTKETPSAHELVCMAKGTSTVTLDAQSANTTCEVYCFFFNQARQDGQSISSDNDS